MSSERQDHTEISPWWGEHVHRYLVALNYISENDKILDLACGNGFGSKLLSEKTKQEVTGGDISEESISYCRSAFKDTPNLNFKVIDGTNISFSDGYFNVVASFETIEHTVKYREMLAELRRVLVKDGYAIISTPNIIVNSPTGKVLNPFHTQEFTYDELNLILKEVFEEVEIYGQRYIRYKRSSFRNRIGKIFEAVLYMRGMRKLPLSFQNIIMKMAIGKDMYPSPDDYEMTKDKEELLKCKTFFAICRKR
jgi:ubiquinone/menaquinone biosynthesis C-methylase UbiE